MGQIRLGQKSVISSTNSVDGTAVNTLQYTYDAIGRPVSRNNDSFGYNNRSEVTSATVDGVSTNYWYDEIGNSTAFTVNCLNQYTEYYHDYDGNLFWSFWDNYYSYDAANRLVAAGSNHVDGCSFELGLG